MGIVNVTPDSFFAGARTSATTDAVARGRSLFQLGVDVVDVGGESTRPGALDVSDDEELSRVIPVLEELAGAGVLSIDTKKESVAREAVRAGASILNDVSGSLAEVAGSLRVGYVAMHRSGESATMQDNPHYDDVVAEVSEYLGELATRARASGVTELWLDPGIGFGKTTEHNLTLLAATDVFVDLAQQFNAGVLVGTSRKRFLGALAPTFLEVDERLEGSVASAAWAMVYGASMVRVHDARATLRVRDLIVGREKVGA